MPVGTVGSGIGRGKPSQTTPTQAKNGRPQNGACEQLEGTSGHSEAVHGLKAPSTIWLVWEGVHKKAITQRELCESTSGDCQRA